MYLMLRDEEEDVSLLPEDESVQCGYGAFSLPKDHPFTPACAKHDSIFDAKEVKATDFSRKQADYELLDDMLTIARAQRSVSLRLQAYAYFAIARAFGKLFW